MKEDQITITLKKDEALVLFEFVTKLTKEIHHKDNNSDTYALWALENSLEVELAEPFLPNYDKIITEAKKRLVDYYKLE